jgi:hypothetical protein
MKCLTCRTFLSAAAERPDGLPGIFYRTCAGCGYSRAVTRRPRKETIPEATAAALDMNKLFPPAGAVDAWPSTLPADVVLDVLSEIGLGAPEATA